MSEFISLLQSLVTNSNEIARLLGALMVFICGGSLMLGGGHAIAKLGGAISGVFVMVFAQQIVSFISNGH